VRCNQNLERAFKSTDLLLHGGGFGLIALSLADMPPVTLRRIISTWWFRFRRALEDTPAVLLVMTPVSCTRSCAAMAVELKNEGATWLATNKFVPPEEKDLAAADNHSAPHLSLVADERQAELPRHSHFLASSTIRMNRERPVEWTNQIIRFTPRLALTAFGNIR
jgi:hypothetical protein